MKVLTQAPRGTQDILPSETDIWRRVEQQALKIAQSFGFLEIRIPTFEYTELFQRSVGDTTDVVQKEMFTFQDRGGRSLSLRPEGTAGAVRAVLESGRIGQKLPLKVCYLINCFRNERPQAGRYKEFHQFGAEMFGAACPCADAEMISLASQFFKSLQIHRLRLEINSIGCCRCRSDYQKVLSAYFFSQKQNLCSDCLERLEKNPLRLLDCKNPKCKEIAGSAPKITQYLCEECAEHFSQVQQLLQCQQIDFVVNPNIVRGLDYYSRTVFEFVSEDLGAQSTVCGGGRYDKLVETMGGVQTPALGFAVGLERLLLIMKAQEHSFLRSHPSCELYLGALGKSAVVFAARLASELRKAGIWAETDLMERSVKAQMRYADKIHARFSCIIGETEMQSGRVAIRQMEDDQKTEVSLCQFTQQFKKIAAV